MGACISKKGVQDEKKISSSISTATQPTTPNPLPTKSSKDQESAAAPAASTVAVKNPTHGATTKKDNEVANEVVEEPKRSGVATKEDGCNAISAATVRTSSCTKEEVDAILIQCGRLSRSSSGRGSNENGYRSGMSGSGSKKYSGSKRSYDFDNDPADNKMMGDDEMPQIRLTHRRTPSRERDAGSSELKRSSSRDEGRRSGSRRASRSPGRRQETPVEKTRPGKMVSVPATVSTTRETVRRVSSTKRSGEVGGRGTASPRARSPANNRTSAENAHQHNSQPSLSRNSSRKTEQSPYRRTPMNEIDGNVVRNEQLALKNQDRSLNNGNSGNKGSNIKPTKNTEGEEGLDKASHLQKSNESETQTHKSNENEVQIQKSDDRSVRAVDISNKVDRNNSTGIREQLMNCRQKEQQREPEIMEEPIETKGPVKSSEIAVAEGLNRPTLTRTRSSRRSRDLDIGVDLNPDSLNPPTYASLLLEDIQNYHQQNAAAASFSLPACVSKARSILEAVADLNSCTTSNLSSGFSEYKSEADPSEHYNCNSFGGRLGKRRPMAKDPFMESEVAVNENDLMEPSLHKYVTVRNAASEMDPQESAGSNSFLGHHWPSSWEPNSADSTDRWASASNASEEVEQKTLNEMGQDHEFGARRLKRCGIGNNSRLPATTTSSGKKRDFSFSQQGGGIGSGKISVRSSSLPVVAAAAQ